MSITKSFARIDATGSPAAAFTSAAFDSSGCTHVCAGTKHETNNAAGASVDDNKNSVSTYGPFNKQTQQQVQGAGASWGQLHWQKIGNPGTGHTVTMTTNAL